MGRSRKNIELSSNVDDAKLLVDGEQNFASKSEVDAVRSDISKVTDALVALSAKIDGLSKPEPVVNVQRAAVEEDADPAKRMPRTYRAIIDEYLSPYFEASVEWRNDGNFELAIEIPKEFSNATSSHWTMYKKDVRVKVIPNALAENGVRDYVQSVAKNLGEVIMNNVKQMK